MTWLTWVAARPDGARIAIGDSDGGVRIWAPAEGRIAARQAIGSRVRVVAWTADGARLLAVGEGGDVVHVFEGDGAAKIGTFATRHAGVLGLATHPSRPLVVSSGVGGHVRLWDLSAGLPDEPLHDMEEPANGRCAAISETHFAVGSDDGSFAAWEIDGGKAFLGSRAFGSYVASMAFTHDGRSLLLGGGKGGLVEMQLDAELGWKQGNVWPRFPPKPIATNAIVFAPDGRFACAHSDRTGSLFESLARTVPNSHLGSQFWLDKERDGWKQEYIVSGICFVPGTRLLVTTCFDGRVRVFEDRYGTCKAEFDPADEAAVSAAAVPFGGAPKAKPAEPKAAGARTLAEMRFAASLRPCTKCGAPPAALAMEIGEGRCTFSGQCRFCGTKRTDAIAGDCDAPWPTHELGDARPSPLVAPGSLLAELARSAPGEKPRTIDLVATAAFAARRDRALECLLELLKHVPEGGAIARVDGEPVTREQLGKALDRMLSLGPDDRAPPPAQPPIVNVLAKPATVGALETALGIRFAWSHLAAANVGKMDLPTLDTPLLGPRVVRLEAKYGFSFFSEEPLAKLDALRRRELSEWTATLVRGFASLDAALREKVGAPREVDGKRVYDTWILAKSGDGDACALSWFAKLPDWAVVQPDAPARESALRALGVACAAATDAAGLASAAAAVPKGCGIEARAEAMLLHVSLTPAVPALELARIFDWKMPVGQAFTMHLTDWQVRLVTGETDTAAPSFGAWPVIAELAAFPNGAMLTKVGISGTRALGPEDVVKSLLVGRR